MIISTQEVFLKRLKQQEREPDETIIHLKKYYTDGWTPWLLVYYHYPLLKKQSGVKVALSHKSRPGFLKKLVTGTRKIIHPYKIPEPVEENIPITKKFWLKYPACC